MNEDIKKRAWKSLEMLDLWIENNGWAGWDPYDIRAKEWVLRISEKALENRRSAIRREIVFEVFNHFPLFCRHLMNVRPQVNAKAMGLFACAYLDLYNLTREEKWFSKAHECLDWLSHNKAMNVDGSAWGYPFDWYSNQLIPAGTPNGIVTTVAGEAFWKAFSFLSDESYLKECINIAHFLAVLPKHETGNDSLCFSYTPLYVNHVHNLNLFVAEYLIRIGKKVNNQGWIDMGIRAVNYTLASQADDGSFDYNGPPEKPARFIDHYHTCFVLRMLHSIWIMTGNGKVYTALERCYRHYVKHFFRRETIPKLLPNRTYRIDIHSCAEAINCLCTLGKTFPGSISIAGKVLDWTIRHLQTGKGYFCYGFLKSRFTGIVFKSKIPYMRWAQAWMMRALSTYVASINT